LRPGSASRAPARSAPPKYAVTAERRRGREEAAGEGASRIPKRAPHAPGTLPGPGDYAGAARQRLAGSRPVGTAGIRRHG
ncbi:hypothetical protein, partial [Streptomyces lincolnensis]|uniref:hypothetical protein n=1 Tax=Streptomyces lincolnensis TaxID=1915 RepID=UPI0037CDB39D